MRPDDDPLERVRSVPVAVGEHRLEPGPDVVLPSGQGGDTLDPERPVDVRRVRTREAPQGVDEEPGALTKTGPPDSSKVATAGGDRRVVVRLDLLGVELQLFDLDGQALTGLPGLAVTNRRMARSGVSDRKGVLVGWPIRPGSRGGP